MHSNRSSWWLPSRAFLVGLTLPGAACVEPAYSLVGDAETSSADPDAAVSPDAARSPTVPPESPPQTGVVPFGMHPSDSCDPAGLHVLQLDAVVEWDPASLVLLGIPFETVRGGRGHVRIVGLAEIVPEGSGWRGSIRPCASDMPDFSAWDQKYGAFVPDETWLRLDRHWDATLHAPCTRPDCMISSSFLSVQLGLDLPETVSFPAHHEQVAAGSTRDEDGDGLPGVTVRMRGPEDLGGYDYPRAPSGAAIHELMVALRIGADLLGTIQTCDVFSGDGRRPAIAMLALGCRVEGGRLCDAAELGYVNENFPGWRVPSLRWQSERLPANASCAEARARLAF